MSFVLSWIDARAPAAVAAATRAAADPAAECARLCNYGAVAPLPDAPCCGGDLWLPTFTFRNLVKPPAYVMSWNVAVEPSGAVVWRVTVQSEFFCSMQFVAFPLDTQTLDLFMEHQQTRGVAGGGEVRVIPSATGKDPFRLVASGADDADEWEVKNVLIFTQQRNLSSMYTMGNSFRRSADHDPAPYVPADGGEGWGTNIDLVEVTVSIVARRLSWSTCMNSIVPVLVVAFVALCTFFLDPEQVLTRFQITVGMFLSLIAVQYVVESHLPRTSTVLPTKQLVLLTYGTILAIAAETLVALHVRRGPSDRHKHHRLRAGREAFLARKSKLPCDGSSVPGSQASLSRALSDSMRCRGAVANGHDVDDIVQRVEAPTTSTLAYDEAASLKEYNAWRARCLDMTSFAVLLTVYVLGAILIFVLAIARQPSVCAHAGVQANCIDQLRQTGQRV